jgi:hypothetical protein
MRTLFTVKDLTFGVRKKRRKHAITSAGRIVDKIAAIER